MSIYFEFHNHALHSSYNTTAESVYCFCYHSGFFLCHSLAHGQRELLGMDTLRYRIREGVPLSVTFLLVGRYWVVYHGLHAMTGKVCLQFIPTLAEYRELMINVFLLFAYSHR